MIPFHSLHMASALLLINNATLASFACNYIWYALIINNLIYTVNNNNFFEFPHFLKQSDYVNKSAITDKKAHGLHTAPRALPLFCELQNLFLKYPIIINLSHCTTLSDSSDYQFSLCPYSATELPLAPHLFLCKSARNPFRYW